ncbi:hypothetical protein HBN50_06985 [Halobacteriovorax sp. GB3]|uniref:hypothetical protein n=1 Tax=Halobacteriovorax sp. GB3 TaxID=2719615 RepID=UPI00235EB981|nr:hypothetical protein [Halobacteriovorax sp. GB3]MDD0852832.1 hypothetical protein [Halobacteriovorax sp. GB3]
MATINKIIHALNRKSTDKPVQKLVDELRETNKRIYETQRELKLEQIKPHQAKGSPYIEDREFFDPSVRQDSDLEASWRNEPKSRAEKAQEIYKEESLKKLNIY